MSKENKNSMGAFDGKSGFRFKIRISDLQSNAKSENGFQS